MSMALGLVWEGLSLPQIAKMPGAPGLRTMRRWCAENLYGFGKDYKEARLEQWTDRNMAEIEALEREMACGKDPGALGAYDRAYERKQERIFRQAFKDALKDDEEPRFTPQQRAVLNLRSEGWSFRKICQYCDAFGAVLETPKRPEMSRDNGTVEKKPWQSLAGLSDEKRKEIFELAALGYSIRQIARDADIPRATLQRWAHGPLCEEFDEAIKKWEIARHHQ